MWTSTLDLDPKRAIATALLGRIWRGAYFASFAPLQVGNLPRQPLPAPGWVRVRNRLAGICGRDLQLIYLRLDPRTASATLGAQQPLYPGHEVVGEVIEVGDEVERLQVGDTVVLQYGPNCLMSGQELPCPACSCGDFQLCERSYQPGPVQIGSGWSEEMLVHEQQLFRVPESATRPGERLLSDEQAVMLEPTAVALHAVLRRPLQAGERALVIGAGSIGLLTLQVLRALSPQSEVDVMARYAFQVERATRLGAVHIIYPQDSYREVARVTGAELLNGVFGNQMLLGGYDVIYDTVGSSRTVQDALRWTRAGGTVVLVGLSLRLLKVDLTPIWQREVNLIGSLAHGQEQWPLADDGAPLQLRSTFSIAAELIAAGALAPEQLITHRFPLTEYRHALTVATHKAQTRAIKVLFDYALQPATVVPNVRASRSRRTRQTLTATFPAPLQLTHGGPTTTSSRRMAQGREGTPQADEIPLPGNILENAALARSPESTSNVTNDSPQALQLEEPETSGLVSDQFDKE